MELEPKSWPTCHGFFLQCCMHQILVRCLASTMALTIFRCMRKRRKERASEWRPPQARWPGLTLTYCLYFPWGLLLKMPQFSHWQNWHENALSCLQIWLVNYGRPVRKQGGLISQASETLSCISLYMIPTISEPAEDKSGPFTLAFSED